MDNKTTSSVKGPKGAVAKFKRSRDGVLIWVFARTGESKEAAIARVKRHNGSEGVEHQTL